MIVVHRRARAGAPRDTVPRGVTNGVTPWPLSGRTRRKRCVSTDRKAENSRLTFAASCSADKHTRSLTFPKSLSLTHTVSHGSSPRETAAALKSATLPIANLPRLREQSDCSLLYLNITATAGVCVCALVIHHLTLVVRLVLPINILYNTTYCQAHKHFHPLDFHRVSLHQCRKWPAYMEWRVRRSK